MMFEGIERQPSRPHRAALPFVLQLSVAVGLVGFLWFRNGQRAIDAFAVRLLGEVSLRVEQNLLGFVAIPHAANRVNAAAIGAGRLDLQDPRALEGYFLQQLQTFESLTFVGIGLENRNSVGVERSEDGTPILQTPTPASDRLLSRYRTNARGDRLAVLDRFPFDPRARPWYAAAVEARQPVWSEIYSHPAGATAYLGAAAPLYAEDGELLGVLLASVSLGRIGQFLERLEIGNTGQAFIVERSGLLVATSTAERPLRRAIQGTDGVARIAATDSTNFLTRAAATYLGQRFDLQQDLRSPRDVAVNLAGQRYFLQVRPLEDTVGLDWLGVVLLPERDFTAEIQANTRNTILLCGLTFFLTVLAAIVTGRWPPRSLARTQGQLAPAIAPTDAETDGVSPEESSQPAMGAETVGLHVLIASGEPADRQLLSRILASQGHGTVLASRGREVLQRLAAGETFDLVLLDVGIPELTSYELTQRLRERYGASELPILLVSAETSEEDLVVGLKLGANDYLTKPIVRAEFWARLEIHVRLRQLHRQHLPLLADPDLEARVRARTQSLEAKNQQLELEALARRKVQAALEVVNRKLDDANRRLEILATQDELTQLANRRHFNRYLAQAWRLGTRDRHSLALILGDIDYFKRFNDTYGHAQGDLCLHQVARAIARAAKRPLDLAARYGGEEFAVVLPDTDAEGGQQVAAAIQAEVARLQISHAASEAGPYVTMSMGVAVTLPDDRGTPEALFEAADAALYRAKERGRNGIVVERL